MSDVLIFPKKETLSLAPSEEQSSEKRREIIFPIKETPTLTRDLPEKIESNINQKQEIFNLVRDPEEEKSKAMVAKMLSYSSMNIGTTEFMYENVKTIVDVLFGEQKRYVKEHWDSIKEHWHYTWDVAEMLKLYEKQWLEGDMSEETAIAIEELEKNLPIGLSYTGSLLEEFAHGVIDQLPMYQEAAKEAGVYGLLLTAFGGASGFLTAGSPGAFVGAKAGATVGTTIGATKGFFKYLGTHAYRDLIKVYGIDPKLARIGAFFIGAWEAGTEILVDMTAIGAIKTAPRLFERTMQGTFLNLVHILGHALRTGTKEAGTELLQELGAIVVEESVKRISNAYRGTDLDPITLEEEIKRMEAAVRGGFIVAGGLTGIGISVSALSQSIHDVYENPRLVSEYQEARILERAQENMQPEKIKSLDNLYQAAQEEKSKVETNINKMAEETNAALTVLREKLKDRERAEIKIKERYGEKIELLKDINAGALIYDTEADLQVALKELESRKEVVYVDDRIKDPTPLGYQAIALNITTDTGHIYEVLLSTKQEWQAREQFGHAIYKVYQEIDSAIKKTKISDKNRQSLKMVKKTLAEISTKYYETARTSGLEDATVFARASETMEALSRIETIIAGSEISTSSKLRESLNILSQSYLKAIPSEISQRISEKAIPSPLPTSIVQKEVEIKAKIEKIPPLEVEEFTSEEEVIEYEKLEKAEEKGEFIPLSRYTERQRRLAERATTIKGRIRTTVGKMSMEKLIIEEKIARVAKKIAGGKLEKTMREAKRKAALREIRRQKKQRKKWFDDIFKIDTSKMTQANAKPIDQMKAGFDPAKPRKKTIARLKATREYLENNPNAEVPDYVIENLKRLDKKNWQDMTTEEVESAHDAIMHHVHLEKEKNDILVRLEHRAFVDILNKSIAEMKAPKDINKETAFKELPFRNARKFGRALIDTIGIRSDHYDLIIEKLAGANSTIDKVLYQAIKEGDNEQIRFRQEIYEKFQKDVVKTKIEKIDKWLRERETVNGIDLSRAQRMALYRHSLNEDNRLHILEGGIGTRIGKNRDVVFKLSRKDYDAILGSLTKEEKAFAGEPVDNLFDHIGEYIARIFYEKNGYPMKRVEGSYYPIDTMPIGRAKDFEAEEILEKIKGKWTRIGLEKGMLEKRIGSKIPIYLNPITYDINKAVTKAAAYVGLEIPLSNASKLLYNPKFKAELKSRYSDITWTEIEKGLRDVAGAHQSYTTVEEIMMKMKNNLTTATLGLPNIFVMLKQPISYACYWPYVDIKYMMAGLTDSLIHRKSLKERHMLYSVEFKERVEGGYSRDVTDVLRKKAERRLYGGKKEFRQETMTGIQWFDGSAVVPGMQAAVLQVLDQFKEGKLSHQVKKALDMENADIAKLTTDDKVKLAYKYADYATERSQPMFSAIHRSSLSRGTPVEQMFTMYSSFTNQALALIRRSWVDLKMNKSKETMAIMGKVLFATLVANSLAVAGLDEFRDWLYGRKKKSFILRMIRTWAGYLYFIRDIITPITDQVERGTFIGYDFEIPIMRMPNLLINTVANGTRAITGEDKKAFGKFIDNGADLIFTSTGIPYSPARNLIKGLTRR